MTFKYNNVYLNDTYTIAGKYEKKGPLNNYFDKTYDDFYFKQKTWEDAESYLIKESINNAKIFKKIQNENGTFYNYLKKFTKNKTIYEIDKTTSNLSDSISNDLKKRGMKFVGSTIIYSYLQAIGVIYSHDEGCFLYKTKEE